MQADRNLLWGVVALHAGVINDEEWRAVVEAWLRDPSLEMWSLIALRRHLPDEDRLRVEDLVRQHVSRRAALPHTLAAQTNEPEPGNGIVTSPQDDGVSLPRRFGGYELLEKIAQGGMGIVYRARQLELDRVVAVKMILAGQFATEGEVERFRTEALAAAQLQHPSIVAIHEVGKSDGQHFFSMDFVDGRSLDTLVHDRPLAPRRASEYVLGIAEAIHYAHERGVLHRDLKPANVLLDPHDRPRVTDFGLAKRIDSTSNLTATGAMLGTPSYMPPEQVTGDSELLGPATDVYALGAILYELLTTRPPFRAATPLDTLVQVVNNEPVAPRLLTPKIPRDLETICLKCLEKEPSRRYASAAELANELGRFLANKPILAQPIGPAGRLVRWCRRRPALASLGVALLFAIAIGFAAVTWQWRVADANRRLAEANFAQAASAAGATLGVVDEWLLSLPPGRELEKAQSNSLQKAIEVYGGLQRVNRDQPEARLGTATGYRRLGSIYKNLHRPRDARMSYEQALSLYASLAHDFPDESRYRQLLAECQDEFGQALRSSQRAEWHADAQQAHNEAIALARSMLDDSPEHPGHRQILARALYNRGVLHADSGAFPAAAADFDAAFQIQSSLAEELPDSPNYHLELARTQNARGSLYRRQERVDAALNEFEQALALYESLLSDDHASDAPGRDVSYQLSVCYMNRGNAWRQRAVASDDDDERRTHLAAARNDFEQAMARLAPLVSNYPGTPTYLEEAANCYNALAFVLALEMALSDSQPDADALLEAASSTWSMARDTYNQLLEIRPMSIDYRQRIADVLLNLAQVRFHADRFLEPADLAVTRELLDEAISHQQYVLAENQNSAATRAALAQLFLTRGSVHLASNDVSNAHEDAVLAGALELTDGAALLEILVLHARCFEQAALKDASAAKGEDGAGQALQLIINALRAGYLSAVDLQATPELKVLLARPEFAAALEATEVGDSVGGPGR